MGSNCENKRNTMQHIFVIGCKGIPAQYGGFETFIEKLTQYRVSKDIQYHIACAVETDKFEPVEITHNNAQCFNVKWKNIGSAKAIFYDLDAIKYAISYVKKNKINHPIFYILACRIGPFIGFYKKQIKKIGGHLYVNPDGHEWKRAKWSFLVRKYWKLSEKLMVKHADFLICDSESIERYIQKEYKKYNPKTIFIAYGAETSKSILANDDERLLSWYKKNNLKVKRYFLVVGRFVPENNFETIIREFMKSKTDKNLVIISTMDNKFLEELKIRVGFDKDKRIKFVGTVYEQELLKKIRENAYGNLHGHEVGGTNPSLLEALSSTDLNLLLDVEFNREVGGDCALYWTKDAGSLAGLIDMVDGMATNDINQLSKLAKKRISDWYNWEYIVNRYESFFLTNGV